MLDFGGGAGLVERSTAIDVQNSLFEPSFAPLVSGLARAPKTSRIVLLPLLIIADDDAAIQYLFCSNIQSRHRDPFAPLPHLSVYTSWMGNDTPARSNSWRSLEREHMPR